MLRIKKNLQPHSNHNSNANPLSTLAAFDRLNSQKSIMNE